MSREELYSEEQLMAYADGELPADDALAITEAAKGDATLARRIERYTATRRLLQQAFAPKLKEPVPQRLLDLLQGGASKVVPLRPRVSARKPAWLPLALAASVVVVVGLLSSRQLQRAPDTLSVALESTPSGVAFPTGQGEIVALSTLRTADGHYCREYEQDGARGLACREAEGRWAERAVAAAPEVPSGKYQTASGEGDAAAALGAQRLTAEEEKKLLEQHWR